MQIRMINPPCFMEVLRKTRGPQLFENGYQDLTNQGGLIIGSGILAMIGAYFVVGLASIPASLLFMGLAYTILKVQRAQKRFAEIQQALKVLNDVSPQVDLKSLVTNLNQTKGIEEPNKKLSTYDAVAKTLSSKLNTDKSSAVTKLQWTWPQAKFEQRRSETDPWEHHTQEVIIF